MFKTLIILIIFFLLAFFLCTYKLVDVPPGINGDEAAIGYLATLISKTGFDANGRFLPLFTNVSWPDWKQPVTIYATVLMFKLFGISFYNLRLVSVIFVLLSGVIIYFSIRELFNQRLAIFSLFIYLTIPIILIQSHLALENIAPLPFISLWLWMLAKYSQVKKNIYLIFAGLAIGASLYSYLGLRLIMPILTILTGGYVYYINRAPKFRKSGVSAVLIFFLAISPFLILLFLIRNQYPGAIFALNHPRNITSYQEFLLPYISSFDLSFMFMKGDATNYHSTGRQGMFLLATLPLFILGIFKIVRMTKAFFIFILLVFFTTPILYGLPGSVYRASRLLTLIPPFVIITVLGFQTLLGIKKTAWRIGITILAISLIFLNYIDFALDYWNDYSNRVNQDFEKPIHQVYAKVVKLSRIDHLDVYIQDDAPLRNPIVYNFLEASYFPHGLKRWTEGQVLPPASIVMVSSQVYHRMNKPDNVEVVDNGDIDLNLLINRKTAGSK